MRYSTLVGYGIGALVTAVSVARTHVLEPLGVIQQVLVMADAVDRFSSHTFEVRGRKIRVLSLLPQLSPRIQWALANASELNKPLFRAQFPDLVLSWLIEKQTVLVHDVLMTEFKQHFHVAPITEVANHPHPKAASVRSASSYAITGFVLRNGYTPYSMGKSHRDTHDGQRIYYAARDNMLPFAWDHIRDSHVLTMIDTDYYYDMPTVLANRRPILMYTFVPMTTGGVVPNGIFSILDDVVTVRINGSAPYVHRVWDYDTDFLTVSGEINGNAITTYAVSQYVMEDDPNRRVIFLMPVSTVHFPMSTQVPSNPLRRRTFTQYNEWVDPITKNIMSSSVNMLKTISPTGELTHLSAPGMADSVSIPTPILYDCIVRMDKSGWKNMGDVERILGASKIADPVHGSVVIYNHAQHVRLSAAPLGTAPKVPKQSREHVIHYDCAGPKLLDNTPKMIAREFAPCPLSAPACVPVSSYNNDVATIAGRVDAVRNKKTPPSQFTKYAQEFGRLLFKHSDKTTCLKQPHTGLPLNMEEVYNEQKLAAQRLRADNERWLLFCEEYGFDPAISEWHKQPLVVKSFQKRESYSKVTHPRNISTVPTDHTLRLSGFTYSFKHDVLKHQPWYMPMHTPASISHHLLKFVSVQQLVLETDFSKFDGSISQWLRENVEFAAYLAWADPAHKAELSELLYSEEYPFARTRFGVVYEAGGSRLSGSPLTTDGNCLINAFIQYCANRHAGIPMAQAWDNIGMIYGDDGVTVAPVQSLKTVALELGLQMPKIIERRPHDNVMFLGRLYIDLWVSDESVQDPKRTLGKINITLTNSTQCPLALAALNRVGSYLVTDSTSPILGEWCRAVQRIYAGAPSGSNQAEMLRHLVNDRTYMSQFVENNSWPQLRALHPLAVKAVAASLGVYEAEVVEFDERLKSVTTLAQLEQLGTVDHMGQYPEIALEALVISDDGVALVHPPPAPELISPTPKNDDPNSCRMPGSNIRSVDPVDTPIVVENTIGVVQTERLFGETRSYVELELNSGSPAVDGEYLIRVTDGRAYVVQKPAQPTPSPVKSSTLAVPNPKISIAVPKHQLKTPKRKPKTPLPPSKPSADGLSRRQRKKIEAHTNVAPSAIRSTPAASSSPTKLA